MKTTPTLPKRTPPWGVLFSIACIWFVLVGCVGSIVPVGGGSVATGLSSFSMPRWICPSPTPLPTREKPGDEVPTAEPGQPTPTAAGPIYYEPWEQEYGLPLMTPTPYVREGTTFFIGQFVEVADDVYAQTTVSTQALSDTASLYIIQIEWTNATSSALSLNPARQIVLNGVKMTDGRQRSGNWSWSREAAQAANLPTTAEALITALPQGKTTIKVPIIAPPARAAVIDLRLDGLNASDSTSAGNMRVQLVEGETNDCDSPGVTSDGLAQPGAGQPIPIPAGTDAIVASALTQVGRQYCWGGKGYTPCSGCSAGAGCVTPACASLPCFDCSGLTWWSYHTNGVTIGHGTSNQQLYQEVPVSQVTNGDLALFTTINSHSRSGITHVGLIGDVNQDGKWDLIHSANYPDGVVISYDFLNSNYYRSNLIVVTRPARSGGV